MFLSLDYLYVPAPNIDAAVGYYTEQLGGELVWKIHAFDTWVAAVRLSASGPMVLLAASLFFIIVIGILARRSEHGA